MRKALIVLGFVLAAGVALVALVGFIRFNFTDGGDDLGSGDPPMTTRPSVQISGGS